MPGIATQADIEAIDARGLPADLPASTYEMIRRSAAIDPQAPALSFFLETHHHARPETWTYAQLLARITQTANAFHVAGATRETVITFVLPNLPETHCVIWGGQAAGIVLAINPLLEPAAIAELINAAGASILVTLAPFPGTDLWPKMQSLLPQLKTVRELMLVDLSDRVRGLRRLPAKLLQRREARRLHGRRGIAAAVPSRMRVHGFNALLDRQPADRLCSARHIGADDYSSFFCTGGTTGLPKIAMRRHRNEVANAWSAGQFMGQGIGPGKNVLCGLPLFHVNGVLVTGLLPFSRGAHVILATPQGYRGAGVVPRFWEIVERHRIHFFSGVPTLYASLLQVPIDGHKVDSLEYGLCGAAPMPVEVFRSFQERTGLKILEGYGLTEATCVSSVNPPLGDRRLGSIGLSIPGQRMKAVLLDDQGAYLRDCATDEVGLLVVSGPNVFAGYRQPEQNRDLWVDTGDGGRWLNTGDLGRQDRDGYFWLTGRKKELIIRGGHNIDPATIEEPLHRHPAVQIAAAVGRPDAHAGELPVAYVQLRPGTQATEAQLADFLKQEIAERAALPKRICIIEQMPLTAVGKIFKPELKRREIHDALMAAAAAAGAGGVRLEVQDDARRGITVSAFCKAEESRLIQQALGRFPFSFQVHVR